MQPTPTTCPSPAARSYNVAAAFQMSTYGTRRWCSRRRASLDQREREDELGASDLKIRGKGLAKGLDLIALDQIRESIELYRITRPAAAAVQSPTTPLGHTFPALPPLSLRRHHGKPNTARPRRPRRRHPPLETPIVACHVVAIKSPLGDVPANPPSDAADCQL